MQHIKQGNNECFPTTLAMLTGVDVNKIISDANVLGPNIHSWAGFGANEGMEQIITVYRALARKYAPWLVDHCEPVAAFKLARDKRYMSYKDYMDRTAKGRGAVLLGSRYLHIPAAHICAYENGLIYCGNQDGPMKAHDYYVKMATKTPLAPYGVVAEY